MAQPTLFDAGEIVLTDGEKGRTFYVPRFVDAATAARWFAQLREAVPWRTQRRVMYDREVDVPRMLGHFRLDPPAPSTPVAVLEARQRVSERLQIAFNAVGLNLYRDGRDSVAPHNDHLEELQRGYPIALLSLGSARRMDIRSKHPPRRALHVELEPGSLLMMSWRTQLNYDHGIPKTGARVGARISAAFRRRPEHARGGFYRGA